MKLAAKRDKNEGGIIDVWNAMGAYVERISGPGLADTLVHYKGQFFRAEVKGAKCGLTPKQVKNFTKAYEAGVPTFIIRTTDDAKWMLECHRGTLLYAALTWKPEMGAMAGASRKERPFRPGTDRTRTLAECCSRDGCATSRSPGMSECAGHAAEAFAPPVAEPPCHAKGLQCRRRKNKHPPKVEKEFAP